MNIRFFTVFFSSLVVVSSFAFADACKDLTDACGVAGVLHTGHAGYQCTVTVDNEQVEDFNDIREVERKWETGDVNCSCYQATATYTETQSHTNTNNVNLSAQASLTVGAELSATVGAGIGGLTKAEATATASWEGTITTGGGWGQEDTDEEELTAATGFTTGKCTEWHYNKWYWKGTPSGTADLTVYFIDDLFCTPPNASVGVRHGDVYQESGAITSYAHGLKDYDGTYNPHGQGFQNWDIRCSKCNSSTQCYKYECPGEDCIPCDQR